MPESTTLTLQLTISPGSEEYRIPKPIELIQVLPGVADVEEVEDVE